MQRAGRIGLILLIVLGCIVCDQVTKPIARDLLATSPPIPVLGGLARFQYTENTGAFMGLGSNLEGTARVVLLIAVAGISLALTILLVTLAHGVDRGALIGLSLLSGGGLSNLIDRIFHQGAVIDYVSLGIGRVRTGIFNLADVAIMAGAFVLTWASIQSAREKDSA